MRLTSKTQMPREMRPLILLIAFLTLTLQVVSGQDRLFNADKFAYSLYSHLEAEHVTWTGVLIDQGSQDTLLIIRNQTHDDPAPVTFFNEQGSRFIYTEKDSVKIYNLSLKTIIYKEPGIIWHGSQNHYDVKNNILFYFVRKSESNYVDLVAVNAETLQRRTLVSLLTSGDPLTGVPSVTKADYANRKLLIQFETKAWKRQKTSVTY